MAQRTLAMGFLALAMLAMMFANSSAQSGCTTTIISMASCLGYISGNSSTPSSSCCSALSNVVQNNPKCLCAVLNGGASSLGVTINNTKALEMPAACKVQTPPVSECNKVNGAPAEAPAATPAAPAPKESTTPAAPAPKASETPATPSTSSTPSVPSVTPAGSGSKATPSTGTTSESSGVVKSGTVPFLFVAALASFTVFLV
ncbi:Bifunctional inhibitor/lipid-transfer protein/seed storage 2S albumin superfamily protein [Rhynchospora pubera]|uniref:Bifunctional inhibitor/lipid-transfer protein/seed storage 2S albumin superfamily protein n=1 Tax=Rhynchospora pubera TaxID=906938 RepID=A0AAV8BNY9_9POAL|nr:Bifunctional inhibitor/lipid-transfer protein/seed storage 2S albumin superfamily protein [Rhynchospora pubera]